jgi:hypothetical protein
VSEREPFCAAFDAVVDFYPPETMPEMVYGLVKQTYDIAAGRLVATEVQPLAHDIRQPDTPHPLAPGSDFWPMKMLTDVIVRGNAFAPRGRRVTSTIVRIVVGQSEKRIAVHGDRPIEWPAPGRLRFGAAEPFVEMPMEWSRAYGGFDPRVPLPESMTVGERAQLEFDHPGVYPRNPFGKGYVVIDDPIDGLMLPNLEDPAQPLRPETLVVGDPRKWYMQPLPACSELSNLMMFPRFAWLGIEAWYPPPSNAPLREVALGVLPTNFTDLAQLGPGQPLQPPALQEGPVGQVFPPLQPGTPIVVHGMHPELPQVAFSLPPGPKLDFYIDGKVFPSAAQLTTVLVEPNEARVSLTYAARHWDLPRPFVAGIHKNIPLALRVNAAQTVRYETPPTVRDQVRQGAGGRPGAAKG